MDAARLLFPDSSFDRVYACGLHHHLSDDQVIDSLRETARVLAPDGRFVLLDNIWPSSALNLPAWILRRLDRGANIRSAARIVELVSAAALDVLSSEIFHYSWNGLEAVTVCARRCV